MTPETLDELLRAFMARIEGKPFAELTTQEKTDYRRAVEFYWRNHTNKTEIAA